MLNERQYENVARRLDGENVSLEAVEASAREQIAGDEKAVGAMLNVAMALGAMDRVRRRMLAELGAATAMPQLQVKSRLNIAGRMPAPQSERDMLIGRKPRRVIHLGRWLSVGAAIAASLALAIVITWSYSNNQGGNGPVAMHPIEKPLVADALTGPRQVSDPDLDVFARQVDDVARELLTPPIPAMVDAKMDATQQELNDLMAPPGGPSDLAPNL